MADLVPTDEYETHEELLAAICWDDDEDPDAALLGGFFQTCAGAWKREPDGRWRFWMDPEFEI